LPATPLRARPDRGSQPADIANARADEGRKKAPDDAGAFQTTFRISSVARNHRSAELVIHARGEEIDIFLDMVGDQEAGGRIDVRVAHEEVIVFEAERPILREGVFDA